MYRTFRRVFKIVSFITLVSFASYEFAWANSDSRYLFLPDHISVETLITKSDKADSFARAAALYLELAMAETLKKKPLAGAEELLAEIKNIAAAMNIGGNTFEVTGQASEGQVIVNISGGYYLRCFNPKMFDHSSSENEFVVLREREINERLRFQFLKSREQGVLSEDDIRIAASLASFGHGTNYATEISNNFFAVIGVAELINEEEGNEEIPNDVKDALNAMASAATDLWELYKEVVSSLKPEDLGKADIAGWKRRANDGFTRFLASRGLYRNVTRDFNADSLGSTIKGEFDLLTDKLLNELTDMLSDRINLMNGIVPEKNFNLNDILDVFNANAIIKAGKMVPGTFVVERSGEPLFIAGNPRSIISMICNIASNGAVHAYALKGDKASVKISLVKEGDFAVIRIKDNGPGMAKDKMKDLKKPFNTTGGTGIGLTEAFATARMHGGWIEVASTLDVGSEFTIHLPLAVLDREEEAGTARLRTDDVSGKPDDPLSGWLSRYMGAASLVGGTVLDSTALENNIKAVVPELVNCLMTAAERKQKVVLAIDDELGSNETRDALGELVEALSQLTKRNDELGNYLRDKVVVRRGNGRALATSINSLVERGDVKRENVIVITKASSLSCFEELIESATITAVDDAQLSGEFYYPLVEITLFTLARAIGYDRDRLIKCYRGIPNTTDMSDQAIADICWNARTNSPMKTLILKLIPGAVKAEDKGIYREIDRILATAA